MLKLIAILLTLLIAYLSQESLSATRLFDQKHAKVQRVTWSTIGEQYNVSPVSSSTSYESTQTSHLVNRNIDQILSILSPIKKDFNKIISRTRQWLRRVTEFFSTRFRSRSKLNTTAIPLNSTFTKIVNFSEHGIVSGESTTILSSPSIQSSSDETTISPINEINNISTINKNISTPNIITNAIESTTTSTTSIIIDEIEGRVVPYPDETPLTHWGGVAITAQEHHFITIIRTRITSLLSSIDIDSSNISNIKSDSKSNSNSNSISKYSPWIRTCTDIEILRFIRNKANRIEEAWRAILKHAEWRLSPEGADVLASSDEFESSLLNREIFWLGINANDCPTLVIRTQAHDGKDYNEDPKVFTRFLVWILEKGRKTYAVGTRRQVCVILDRAPVPSLGPKEEKFEMAVITRLIELFRMLYGTVLDNYPELMFHAKVVPVSWFFNMCFGVTSRFMDAHNREKFHMVKSKQMISVMSSLFTADMLPPHLGGTATQYGPVIKEEMISSISMSTSVSGSGSSAAVGNGKDMNINGDKGSVPMRANLNINYDMNSTNSNSNSNNMNPELLSMSIDTITTTSSSTTSTMNDATSLWHLAPFTPFFIGAVQPGFVIVSIFTISQKPTTYKRNRLLQTLLKNGS
eukprot:gene5666-11436_t